MQFRVPKFLEREATIAFGLTFKKLGVVGGAGLLLFLLYYIIPNKIVFIFIALIVAGAVFGFMFLRIKDQSLFSILSKALGFFISPRTYFWQKKQGIKPIKVVKKKEEKKVGATLKLAPKSSLHEIKSKIDLGP